MQPGPGAYLNTGGNTLVRGRTALRGPSGQNAGYASSNSPNAVNLYAWSSCNSRHTSPLRPPCTGTCRTSPRHQGRYRGAGVRFHGLFAGDHQSLSERPHVHESSRGLQGGSAESGPVIGALFSNQAQDSATALDVADDNAQVLDAPVALKYVSTPTYTWTLAGRTSLQTARSDAVVVTHGGAVNRTVCTSQSPYQ